jgi:GNAT superfamily N-acetyltransferase
MITAQLESFTEQLDELKPIFPIHYKELALNQDEVPLDPQYDIYIAREEIGELIFVTLRKKGELIGYFIGFIAPGLHYKTCLTCTMDIFYVHPEHRGNGGGFTLFEFVEKELKRRGVDRWMVGSKLHKDASFLFERLGFERVEIYYSKMLGD